MLPPLAPQEDPADVAGVPPNVLLSLPWSEFAILPLMVLLVVLSRLLP